VDVERFAPRAPDAAQARLAALPARLAATPAGGAPGSSFARDTGRAAEALAAIDPATDRLVVYVGKLIASKGVELLLAAWPSIAARVPAARLVVVGFGAFEPGLRALAGHLARGHLAAARAVRDEHGAPLAHLAAALRDPPEGDMKALDRVVWAGRLEHAELADLLPAAEALVVPSTFPEAFGMVAAEAAACGAFPVVARHSGLAEVAGALARVVPDPAAAWLTFALGPDAVADLAAAVTGWLEAGGALREGVRAAIVAEVRERLSWDGVARTVLAAGRGHLDELPRP
jgi:glycosyltransferase involved in cell wall biosynthesis